jgi:hypothetical protein
MLEWVISRVLFTEAAYSTPRYDDHSSSLDVAIKIKRPTRGFGRTTLKFPLFGLAPDGVCLAPAVTGRTGELLPHRFTLTPGIFRGRFPFCCTFLPVTGTGRYPASCPLEPGLSSPSPEGKAAIIQPTPTSLLF